MSALEQDYLKTYLKNPCELPVEKVVEYLYRIHRLLTRMQLSQRRKYQKTPAFECTDKLWVATLFAESLLKDPTVSDNSDKHFPESVLGLEMADVISTPEVTNWRALAQNIKDKCCPEKDGRLNPNDITGPRKAMIQHHLNQLPFELAPVTTLEDFFFQLYEIDARLCHYVKCHFRMAFNRRALKYCEMEYLILTGERAAADILVRRLQFEYSVDFKKLGLSLYQKALRGWYNPADEFQKYFPK